MAYNTMPDNDSVSAARLTIIPLPHIPAPIQAMACHATISEVLCYRVCGRLIHEETFRFLLGKVIVLTRLY